MTDDLLLGKSKQAITANTRRLIAKGLTPQQAEVLAVQFAERQRSRFGAKKDKTVYDID
jgi:hypothetical protein